MINNLWLEIFMIHKLWAVSYGLNRKFHWCIFLFPSPTGKWFSFVSSIRRDKKQFLAPGFSYFGHEDVPEENFWKIF